MWSLLLSRQSNTPWSVGCTGMSIAWPAIPRSAGSAMPSWRRPAGRERGHPTPGSRQRSRRPGAAPIPARTRVATDPRLAGVTSARWVARGEERRDPGPGSRAARTVACCARWSRQVGPCALAVAALQHRRHQGRADALALPGRFDPEELQVPVGPVRVVVVEQLVDPQEAGRVGAGQLLDPPAQLLGVLAADRDPTGRRPQRGRDHVSCGGVALVVA